MSEEEYFSLWSSFTPKGLKAILKIFVVFNINNRQQNFCNFRAASIAASAGGANSTRPQVKIWPEWTEAELAAEKWVWLLTAKLLIFFLSYVGTDETNRNEIINNNG